MPKTHVTESKLKGSIDAVINAVTDLISRKNAPTDEENGDSSAVESGSTYAQTLKSLADEKAKSPAGDDPAHAPGHRTLAHGRAPGRAGAKVRTQVSALNSNAKSDVIHQHESDQRRIISGASVEKKGRRS